MNLFTQIRKINKCNTALEILFYLETLANPDTIGPRKEHRRKRSLLQVKCLVTIIARRRAACNLQVSNLVWLTAPRVNLPFEITNLGPFLNSPMHRYSINTRHTIRVASQVPASVHKRWVLWTASNAFRTISDSSGTESTARSPVDLVSSSKFSYLSSFFLSNHFFIQTLPLGCY